MVPDNYKIAFAALDAIWNIRKDETNWLGGFLGGMAVNANDEMPMDSGALDDWQQIETRPTGAIELEPILAFLNLDASRYTEAADVPRDLRQLIDALHRPDSPERKALDSVIDTWHDDPEAWPIYSALTKK